MTAKQSTESYADEREKEKKKNTSASDESPDTAGLIGLVISLFIHSFFLFFFCNIDLEKHVAAELLPGSVP